MPVRSSLQCFAMLAVCIALFVGQCVGSDSARLLADMEDGRLDEYGLLDAALVIGGSTAQQRHAAHSQIERLVAVAQSPRHETTLELVQQLRRTLHDRLFTGEYSIAASQLGGVFSSGDYNCVSAATAFMIVADLSGISARAVLVPGHMRCRVWIEEQRRWLDIETTMRDDESLERVGLPGRELTDVQLVAKLYYNRAIDLLTRREFGPALQAAHHSCRLDDRHRAAKDNLIAIINNWALQLASDERYEEALRLIDEGLRDCPDSHLLSTNEVHVYVRWMQGLLAEGDLGGVQARLQTALARHPDSPVLWNIQSALGSSP